MNQTPPTQQPLEFTPAMSVVMVVVMIVGWLGWMGSENEQAFQPTVRPVIKRVTDQAIRIPQCSLSVTPTAGWSHLSIENMIDEEPTFVNQSTQTIATFDRPPESTETSGREVQYDHVNIVWLDGEQDVGGAKLLEGWIQHDSVRARIRILTRAKSMDEDPSIASLCNAIDVDD